MTHGLFPLKESNVKLFHIEIISFLPENSSSYIFIMVTLNMCLDFRPQNGL